MKAFSLDWKKKNQTERASAQRKTEQLISVSASGWWWTGNAGLILQPLHTVMCYWTEDSRQGPMLPGKAWKPWLCNYKIWFHAEWISLYFTSPSYFLPLSIPPHSFYFYLHPSLCHHSVFNTSITCFVFSHTKHKHRVHNNISCKIVNS